MKVNTIDSMARGILLGKLAGLTKGKIVVESDRTDAVGSSCADEDVSVTINIRHPRCFRKILFGGGTGAGGSYINGDWDTDDLVSLIRIITGCESTYDSLDSGTATLSEWKNHLLHVLKMNTRKGSEQNIIAHYDLGNDFFDLFLDETMAYSSGIYSKGDSSLKEASVEKFDRICRKLELSSSDSVVEIGTGWGGFAVHAVENYGCEVVTTTISRKQYAHATELVRQKRMQDKVKVLNNDYRDLKGKFDKLVSIEMIEAVGYQFLDVFIKKCGDLLGKDGRMAIQAITVPDHRYEKHKYQSSFINKYIFPGSNLLSIKAISDSAHRMCGMKLVDQKDITHHYARTLKEWRERFWTNIDKVKNLGLDEEFIRKWNFYLSCCEAAFRSDWTGDHQLIYAKQDSINTDREVK